MIKVEKHPNQNIRDDVYRCRDSEHKPVWIYEEGSPREFRFICCETHLKQIVERSIEYLGEEYKTEILKFVTGEETITPQQMADTKKQLEDSISQCNTEKVKAEAFKVKCSELELELKKIRQLIPKQPTKKKGK